MRQLVFLVLFTTLTSVHAANPDYRNLSKITPCFDPSVVQVSSNVKHLVEEKEVYEVARSKFLAYRTRFLDDCQPNGSEYPWFIHIHVQGKTAKNGFLAYYIEINIYSREGLPGWQSIYNIGTFGIEPEPDRMFLMLVKTKVSEMADKLAADYEKANP